jgi:CRP/FNR family cyclic AMP-dependent transcriptional regulator
MKYARRLNHKRANGVMTMITSRATNIVDVLQHVPLFADLNKREVQDIALLFKEHRFSKGETVVKEGSREDTLFLIDSGEATVFIGGRGAHDLEAGDYFGEVALIDEGTRMATITANELVCHGLAYVEFPPARGAGWSAGSCCNGW